MKLSITAKIERKGAKGGLDRFLRAANRLFRRNKTRSVKVGVLGGGEIAEIAGFNEFGTTHIPERPFLRNGIRDGEATFKAIASSEARSILTSGDPQGAIDRALRRLGTAGQSAIQDSIGSNIAPANAPSTVKKKGSSKTLIDTGRLRQSISYEIED